MKKALVMLLITCVLVLAFASIANAAVNTIYISNQTGYDFYAVYVKPSASSNWGSDLISDVGILYNGQGCYVNLNVYRTSWDIAVKDRNGNWHYWWRWDLSDSKGITLY